MQHAPSIMKRLIPAVLLAAATAAGAAPMAQAAGLGSGLGPTAAHLSGVTRTLAGGKRPPCLPCPMVPASAGTLSPTSLGSIIEPAIGKHPFVLYDNTHYTNLDLEQYGLVKSNVLYEDAASKQAIAAGQVPDQTLFKTRLALHEQDPGPLVLDFEDLYLTGSPATAAYHLRVLTLLARWAHEAAPGKIIGFYGLLNHIDRVYLPLAQQLAPFEDAFFPSLYTFNDDRAQWRRRLLDDLALARQIAPGKPIYPYLWPQYHEGTPKALQYLGASYWRFQLLTSYRYTSGAVIWSSGGPTGSDQWVAATAQFMHDLTGR
jgi:hypothetical protein